MSKIVSHFTSVYSWFNGNPMCERDRVRRQILVTFPEVRLHTPGI